MKEGMKEGGDGMKERGTSKLLGWVYRTMYSLWVVLVLEM